jgi:hypothetical protein
VSEDFDRICGTGNTAGDSERQRGRMMDYPEMKIRAAVQSVLDLLTQKQYHALANLTAPGPEHLQAEDIERTMESYRGTVRMPDESELKFDVVEVEGLSPRQFSVNAPLFTVEEGRSDLTARMTVIDEKGEDYQVVFCDVWVM